MATPPKCPQCGGTKQIVKQGEMYWCKKCQGLFDDDPNEGSDYHADPSRRMQRQEERKRKLEQ